MDISYLLFLQNFRESINDAWTPFMEFISLFAVKALIIIPAFIYWCIDKKKGLYTLFSAVTTIALNAVVKLTACIYRPWIRDPRIVPAGDAITTATGYSFPSGHTTTAVPIYGGIGLTFRKHIWVPVLCGILAVLTCFSRNYLGVHTPQDVLVGILESLLILYIMSRLFQWVHDHPEKEDMLLVAGMVLGIVAIVYITFKPYPTTYIDGKLLVDPQKMMTDGYGDCGSFIAVCLGRFLEKRFLNYKETGLNKRGIVLSLIGVIVVYLISKKAEEPLAMALGDHFGNLAFRMVLGLTIILIWPAVISLINNMLSHRAGEAGK